MPVLTKRGYGSTESLGHIATCWIDGEVCPPDLETWSILLRPTVVCRRSKSTMLSTSPKISDRVPNSITLAHRLFKSASVTLAQAKISPGAMGKLVNRSRSPPVPLLQVAV